MTGITANTLGLLGKDGEGAGGVTKGLIEMIAEKVGIDKRRGDGYTSYQPSNLAMNENAAMAASNKGGILKSKALGSIAGQTAATASRTKSIMSQVSRGTKRSNGSNGSKSRRSRRTSKYENDDWDEFRLDAAIDGSTKRIKKIKSLMKANEKSRDSKNISKDKFEIDKEALRQELKEYIKWSMYLITMKDN
jgi:hypothetical protein